MKTCAVVSSYRGYVLNQEERELSRHLLAGDRVTKVERNFNITGENSVYVKVQTGSRFRLSPQLAGLLEKDKLLSRLIYVGSGVTVVLHGFNAVRPQVKIDPKKINEIHDWVRETGLRKAYESVWHEPPYLLATIRRRSDGARATHVLDGCEWGPGSEYCWSEGNFSCDCNRHDFFCAAAGLPESDIDCGEGRYVVEKVTDHTGKTVYTEV